MDERPTQIRVYPHDLGSVYYTSVLAFPTTPTLEIIRLAMERLQIYEDKTLYELYEGRAGETKDRWTLIGENACPVSIQAGWRRSPSVTGSLRLYLRRKDHASLVLSDIVSQLILPEVDEGRIEDLCRLEELSEQSMLANLRARFSNKAIYTFVGSILISVNPYYYFSVYNPKFTDMYQGRSLGELPPHIFAIADTSYHSMLSDKRNQTVIISGESGAGKTEATKFLLHHLMNLSAKMDDTQCLELITLGTGPVLEAFGNAQTVANNNSSRFGKFILTKFKENGAYYGASIEKYLLEKSRLVSQGPGERNYHVFYYLLAGASPELRRTLRLLKVEQYAYLTQSCSLPPQEGTGEYHRLRQSLSMLGFSDETQIQLFTLLSAILHIGNVTFGKKDGEEAAVVQDGQSLRVIADLLRVEEETLRLALTTRKTKAGSRSIEFFVKPNRVEEALATRDAMAKALYSSMFDWIVGQVNEALAAGTRGPHKGHSIGVLDIFGFEVFWKNSFEQFCINYANEQLQQYFNKHIFKLEQAEYIAEGIEWSSVSFIDNQECLDLIAKKPTGLLPLLDEECSFPGATNLSLFEKFERQHKYHPHYHSPQMKLREPVFTVLHYASEVTYSVEGFREKNRDLMRPDVGDVLRTSRSDLVRSLFGLPPYAVRRWHMAILKIMATFAFRKAGVVHRMKREGLFSASVQFQLRKGSVDDITGLEAGHRVRNMSEDLSASLPSFPDVIGRPTSPEAFPLEHASRTKTRFGMRGSHSYNLLSESEAGGRRAERKHSAESCSQPGKTSPTGHGNATHPPQPPPTHVKRKPSLTSIREQDAKQAARRSKADKQETRERLGSDSRGRLGSDSSRSRLPSFTQLQEKLRRKWPRSLRTSPGSRAERGENKWKSAPKVRGSPLESPEEPHSLRSVGRPTTTRHGPPKTVSGQFQVSLVALMETLEQTNPFFIRCIKSNGEKAPCKFDDELVLRQLRYTGMVETVKIRKAGYPVRMDFSDFYERYQFLMGPRQADLPAMIRQFMVNIGLSSEGFQIGATKVFMQDAQKEALQVELRDKVLDKIVMIQRWGKAKLLRCRFLLMRRSAIVLQCAVRGWLARRRARYLRRRLCNAVMIQAAWRGFVERKNFILLKQAAIIFQAYWRGKMTRKSFQILLAEKRRLEAERRLREEEEQRRLREEEEERRKEEEKRKKEKKKKEEEEKRRMEEERQRAEEERQREEEKREAQRMEAERLRREEEEMREEELLRQAAEKKALERRKKAIRKSLHAEDDLYLTDEWQQLEEALLKAEEEAMEEEGKEEEEEKSKEGKEEKDRASNVQKPVSRKLLLDSEVRSVLFQFDDILSQIERETSSDKPTSACGSVLSSPTRLIAPESAFKIKRRSGSAENLLSPTAPTAVRAAVPPVRLVKICNGEAQHDDVEVESRLENQRIVRSGSVPLLSDLVDEQGPPHVADCRRGSEGVKIMCLPVSSIALATNKLSVQVLQQKFLSPTRRTRSLSPSPSPSLPVPKDADNPIRAGNVRDIISKMQIRASSASPPISPSSPLLMHASARKELGEREAGTPSPPVRRKVRSPFLNVSSQSNSESTPLGNGHSKPALSTRYSYAQAIEDDMIKLEQSVTRVRFAAKDSPISEDVAGGGVGEEEPYKRRVFNRANDNLSFDRPLEMAGEPPQLPRMAGETPKLSTDSMHPFTDESGLSRPLILSPPYGKHRSFSPPPMSADRPLVSPTQGESTEDAFVEAEEIGQFRPRSMSEMAPSSRHRVHLTEDVTHSPIHEAQGTKVTTRDVVSRRRRDVVSVADPTDTLGNWQQLASLDESSDLTTTLSPAEILKLNRHRREVASPADRLRLFSFTKRRLKLPFRARGRKHREEALPSPVSPSSGGTSLSPKHKKPTSPPFSGVLSPAVRDRGEGANFKRHSRQPPADRLAHNMKPLHAPKFAHCSVCNKGYSGFLRQALKCTDCDVLVHRHCAERLPPCKAQIESGSYVTMSRKKVVQKLEDLDDLGQFLLDKISLLHGSDTPDNLVDRVFKLSLHEFHTSLVSSYSLSVQSQDPPEAGMTAKEPHITITFSQLVNNFSNIFKGLAKREGLNDSSYITIGINQIKTFLDEFTTARRRSVIRTYPTSFAPVDLKRKKTVTAKDVQLKAHRGHQFGAQQFEVTTVCEFCTKPIPLLEAGEVCKVCGFTCHENCYGKITKKCEGKARGTRSPPHTKQDESKLVCSQSGSQFGVPLSRLIPEKSEKVPAVLETCFQYIESHGLYTQGIYRKSAGASSKRVVRSALEEENRDLEGCHVHAVASAVGTFFRELPEPLLTKELYVEFIRTMDLTDLEDRQETLHHLIQRLPPVNHVVFERLIFHLARVAQHEHINCMTPSNLAIVFAPCLLRGTPSKKNPQEVLQDLSKQTECLELIIIEQVEKLNSTLKDIEALTSVARDTATKLTQLIEEDSSPSPPQPPKPVVAPFPPLRGPEERRDIHSRLEEKRSERKRLATELEEIERERVELTVNLPKLEPFLPPTEEQEEPWSLNSTSSTSLRLGVKTRAEREKEGPPMAGEVPPHSSSILPNLPSTPRLTPLTKNRVTHLPNRRAPSRREHPGRSRQQPFKYET